MKKSPSLRPQGKLCEPRPVADPSRELDFWCQAEPPEALDLPKALEALAAETLEPKGTAEAPMEDSAARAV